MSLRARLCVAVILALLPAKGSGNVIRVDHAGHGDYLTILEGVEAASPGDTVRVAPGTYAGEPNRGVTLDGITLVSEAGPEVTTVDCDALDYAFQVIGSSVLEGFTVTNARGSTVNGYAAVYSSYSVISNCILTGNPGVGLLTYGENSITDCGFLSNGGSGARLERTSGVISGCLFDASGLSIVDEWYGGYRELGVLDCIFSGVGGAALAVYHESPLIQRCLFVDNDYALHLNNSFAEIRDCTIASNHSSSNGAMHFTLDGHSGLSNGCIVENCIVAFNSCVGSVAGAPDESTFDQNCLFGNAGGDSLASRSSTRSNLFEDPLFCGLGAGDFTLCENSPCLVENEPIGISMGAYADSPGCGPCSTPVRPISWGALKALHRGKR